jgi:serine/threonine-protein kinase RsbW
MCKDRIELSIPTKKEYVKIARLTASSAASSLGFDIEELEDIKVAVGEAINIAFKFDDKEFNEINMIFELFENTFSVNVIYPGCMEKEIEDKSENDLSFLILKSLMDEVKVFCEENSAKLVMLKRLDV